MVIGMVIGGHWGGHWGVIGGHTHVPCPPGRSVQLCAPPAGGGCACPAPSDEAPPPSPPPACPRGCSDQGRCERGRCRCFPGFSGPDCATPACAPGWGGARCDIGASQRPPVPLSDLHLPRDPTAAPPRVSWDGRRICGDIGDSPVLPLPLSGFPVTPPQWSQCPAAPLHPRERPRTGDTSAYPTVPQCPSAFLQCSHPSAPSTPPLLSPSMRGSHATSVCPRVSLCATASAPQCLPVPPECPHPIVSPVCPQHVLGRSQGVPIP